MSKPAVSLPKCLMRNSVIGAAIALLTYVIFQFVSAFLVHKEMIGEGGVYAVVCVSAGVSSFLGCFYSAVKGGAARVLSASAVVAVFLVLTIAVGALTGETGSVGTGLVGVGASMAAGGLLAAMLASASANTAGKREEGKKKRRAKR